MGETLCFFDERYLVVMLGGRSYAREDLTLVYVICLMKCVLLCHSYPILTL